MKTYVTLTALILGFMWLSTSNGEPSQCTDLRTVIPSGCSCTGALINGAINDSFVAIDCRKQNYTRVPVITGSSTHIIYEMTMSDNNLVTIPAMAFQGLRIQRLDLRNNLLTSFDPRAFLGLENDIVELSLGAQANISILNNSLKTLTRLNALTLEYFQFPNNDLLDGVVSTMTSLRSLTLRHNNLISIEPLALPSQLTYLELDHQSIGPYPPIGALRSVRQLQTLIMKSTELQYLSNKAFEYNSQLRTLQFSYNRIEKLEDGCFTGIYDLQTFSLHENRIQNTSVLDPIKNLTTLSMLDVSETGISDLSPGVPFLQNKASLRSLVLESNQLTTLKAAVFLSLGSLTTLSLAKNRISQIDSRAFEGLRGLQSLDLSQQITSQNLILPASLPGQTPGLQQLVLSGTPVDETTLWQRIPSLTSLQVLKLDGTRLSSIKNYAFSQLTQLKELYLNATNIIEVTQMKFMGPRNLAKLYLDNNGIDSISNCAFFQYSRDQGLQISLTGNRLKCDCTLNWLLKAIDEKMIFVSQSDTCASPPDKANKLLNSFKPGNFTCSFLRSDPPCLDLYTTTTLPAGAINTSPTVKPSLSITVVEKSNVSIQVQWVLTTNYPNLDYFRVIHTEQESSARTVSGEIPKTQNIYLISGLSPGHSYSICIYAYDILNNDVYSCKVVNTLYSNGDSSEKIGNNSHEIGIIVGASVAGVVLLAILGAIVYVVFLRKRAESKTPAQPHVFSPSELPNMGSESKSFTREKDNHHRVGRALNADMKVNAISGTNIPDTGGRHSAGSYQYLDENNMLNSQFPSATSLSANNINGRNVPSMSPSQASSEVPTTYLNMGFIRDSSSF
ncbi:leucine-rich repeats and immunoglobulin-like domains protein 2 isoform X2 [Pomacea canaliculata]|uniref:leucine-rich repeats and immunoglobulin-like domains protein 2 isoform X2 n=1 Tax=Pomacea canaliculata TaxID=400727 RepID=UPI000D73E745|nr:leucine-rich repeats and immunoglobulin-like domains protein 2 isoform X2 [Pomacea canaliculata]